MTVKQSAKQRRQAQHDPDEAIVDKHLLEALQTHKDRNIVLKLEDVIVAFFGDVHARELAIPSLNSYERLLAHRTGDYYGLMHVAGKDNMVYTKTHTSIIPATKLGDVPVMMTERASRPSSASSSKFKIMKRETNIQPIPEPRGSRPPSDSASQENKQDKEERYKAARARIFSSVSQLTPERSPSNANARSVSHESRQRKGQLDMDDADYSRYNTIGPSLTSQYVDPVQSHAQYFEAFSPLPRAEKAGRALWTSKSPAPLSIANLAQLEAQSPQHDPIGPSLFNKPEHTVSRDLALPSEATRNLWATADYTSKRASALGLNSSASPWTPKSAYVTAKPSSAIPDNEDDPTNVLRNLALDDK